MKTLIKTKGFYLISFSKKTQSYLLTTQKRTDSNPIKRKMIKKI